MADSVIQIEQLAAEIEKELTIYSDEITEGLKKLAPRVARETAKELNDTSPRDSKSGRHPHYDEQWTSSKLETTRRSQASVVHNRDYGLPHLVEKGHALRGGGRTRAQPHIAPAEEKAIEKYEKGVEDVIRNGG